MKRGGITITELARHAKVSPGTVSIVLNRKPLAKRVPEQTQARILELAEKYDYRPNRMAQAMQQQSTKTIGFICGDLATPYYAELADELSMAAEERGYWLMTQATRWDPDKEFEALEMLLTRTVDGVLMYSGVSVTHSERLERLCRNGHLLVMLGEERESDVFSSISFEMNFGMDELFKFLSENGIRDVALADDPRFPRKRIAYMESCRKYGCRERYHDFTFGDLASIETCCDRIAIERPGYVIISSDYVSAVMVSRLGEHGLRVPEDISIVTIDGTHWAEIYNPPLTAIRQDVRQMARVGINELLSRIEDGTKPSHIQIPTYLHQGKSVKLPVANNMKNRK